MGLEYVKISAGGLDYNAFESFEVHAAVNKGARSFSFVVACEIGPSVTNAIFRVGTEVSITANGDLLLQGYVDSKEPEFEGTYATITVSGRSKSADLIDGSAEHDTGYFEKKDPKEIADEISKKYTQTGFLSDAKLEKLDQYLLTQGESVYRCVEKLARQQGCTLQGTADGKIKITKAGTKRQGGWLKEGDNIKKGKASHNASNRHSEIKVRGQRPSGWGEDNLEIEETEEDSAVKRHRPLIIVQDEDTTKKRAKSRAKNRKDRAAGNALKATIEVQGFHDSTGQVWEPGNLVWTESPFLDIAQDMLIESVDYRQSKNGSLATLNLTDPRSYGGDAGKGNKSGGEWEQ